MITIIITTNRFSNNIELDILLLLNLKVTKYNDYFKFINYNIYIFKIQNIVNEIYIRYLA